MAARETDSIAKMAQLALAARFLTAHRAQYTKWAEWNAEQPSIAIYQYDMKFPAPPQAPPAIPDDVARFQNVILEGWASVPPAARKQAYALLNAMDQKLMVVTAQILNDALETARLLHINKAINPWLKKQKQLLHRK